MSALLITTISSGQKNSKPEELANIVKKKISEDDRLQVNDDTWFVEFDGTPRELSLFLGIQAGAIGGILISEVSSISGYGPTNLNAWFKSHSKGVADEQ